MATWTLLRALFNPRLIVPAVRVRSINHVDFQALKRAGYRGAVFDKDNCLTRPHRDALVPQLRESWADCLRTFGPENVVIVSNATGTSSDPGNLEAESVAYNLGVTVLAHTTKKPGCSSTIIDYFASRPPGLIAASSPPPPTIPPLPFLSRSPSPSRAVPLVPSQPPSPFRPSELIVIGDRVFTDVILGNRLGALSIWTTGLWERELMPMRYFEYATVRMMDAWIGRERTIRKIQRMWIRTRARASALFARERQPSAHALEALESTIPEPIFPPRPQDLFVRAPPPAPPRAPSPLVRSLILTGSILRISYGGARTALVWSFTRLRALLRSQTAPSEAEAETPREPFRARLLSFTGRTGWRIIGLAQAGVAGLIGKERMNKVIVTLRQVSSRVGGLGRRVMRSLPYLTRASWTA